MLLEGTRCIMSQIENLFHLEMQKNLRVNPVRTGNELHKICAHVSKDIIAKMLAWIYDMEISAADSDSCENYIKGKIRRESKGKGEIANCCL